MILRFAVTAVALTVALEALGFPDHAAGALALAAALLGTLEAR